MSEERTFRLGPRERRGLVAGWRPGQVLSTAIGCALAAAVLALSSSVPGVLVALGLLSAGLAGATVPWRGRTLEEWAPVLAWHLRHRGLSQPLLVEVGEEEGAGIVVLEGRCLVVVSLEARGIALLEASERARRVDGLAGALGLLAREGSAVDRVAWSASTSLDDGSGLARDLRRRGRGEVELARDAYDELLRSVAGGLPQRTVHLVLRARSTRAGSSGEATALVEEARGVLRALTDAGHPPGRLLGSPELRALLGSLGFEEGPEGLALVATSCFDHVELGGVRAVAWWVAEWPRTEVTSEMLSAVLLGTPGRTMGVVMEPVPPARALRRAQVARTSTAADEEVRRRGGFLADRRREREAHHVERREAELVDGHSSLRFAGYLSVRAPDEDSLGERIAATELAAAQAGLLLRRCQGDHLRGLLSTWPLAGGLP